MRVYHGTDQELTHIKKGSYVTPFLHAARLWGVKWSYEQLISIDPNKVGETLRFRAQAIESSPLFVYVNELDETQLEKTTTNQDVLYPYIYKTRLDLWFKEEERWSDWKLVIPYYERQDRYGYTQYQ
jgi:hypothetical protein